MIGSYGKCSSVSLPRRWASVISNPLFLRSYLSRNPSPSSWTVVGQDMINQSGINLTFHEYVLPKDMCSRRNFVGLRLPHVHKGERYKVFGASNGLLLFAPVEYLDENRYAVRNIYYLCNPVTGESIRLTRPRTRKFVTSNYCGWGPALVVRVEDTVLRSYRVVLLLPYKEAGCLRATVYASETREWKEYILPCEIPSEEIYNPPTTLNDQILHWGSAYGSIIAYDPYANPDRIRIIAPPPQFERNPSPGFCFYSRMCDASAGGKLRYFEKFIFEDGRKELHLVRFNLWVLEDSGESWRLSHQSDDTSIRGAASRDVIKNLVPMFFDPLDADVLYLADSRRLLSYDVRTRKVVVMEEYAHGRRSNSQLVLSPFAFYLVRPSAWPVSIDSVPCSSSAIVTTTGLRPLLVRGVSSLWEKFFDYF